MTAPQRSDFPPALTLHKKMPWLPQMSKRKTGDKLTAADFLILGAIAAIALIVIVVPFSR